MYMGILRHFSISVLVMWLRVQCLPKIAIFNFFPLKNHKLKCVLLGFYERNQHKVVHNYEAEVK